MATKKGVPSREGFLKKGWAEVVASAKSGKDTCGHLRETIDTWGLPVPKDVTQFLAPLAKHAAPKLAELELVTRKSPAKKGNRAEALMVAAQEYRPLWCELFAGAIEIGSTGSGDVWMYAYDFEEDPPLPGRIFLYAHEGDTIGAQPEADGLESLLFRASIFADKKPASDAIAQLDGHVGTACFEDRLDGSYAVEDDTTAYIWARARWLVTLLAESDPADAEIRGALLKELKSVTMEDIDKRAAQLTTLPMTGFYFGLAAFFTGADAPLKKLIAHTTKSKVPLIQDLGTLLTELSSGKKKALGMIENVSALRQRVIGLDLFASRGREAKPTAKQMALLEKASKAEQLEDFAWTQLEAPNVIAALEAIWKKDKAIGKSLTLLSKIQKADGYRDENAIDRLIAELDPRIEPILVSRAIDAEDKARIILWDILANVGTKRSIAPLAGGTSAVNRFHTERHAFARLVHRAGDASHAPVLAKLVADFPPKKEENARSEMLANVVLALGDLGNKSVAAQIAPLATLEIEARGTNTPIGLRDAALYALGELGAVDALPKLLAGAQKQPYFKHTAGLCWALGHLAAESPKATQEEVRAFLDETRVSAQADQSIASLFDPNLSGMEKDIAREIARESSRVVLGAKPDDLTTLVATVLKDWERRGESDDADWSGYESHAMLAWALIAVRHHPSIGTDLARPFLSSPKSFARILAARVR